MSHSHTRPARHSRRRGLTLLLVISLLFVSVPSVAFAGELENEPFEEDPFPLWPPEEEEPPPEGEDPPEPEPAPWEPNWIDVRQEDMDNTVLTAPGYFRNGLDLAIPAGTQRGVGARYRFELEEDPDEVWFRYLLRFDNWNSNVDGKLPGLAGLYGFTARGCFPSVEESPGWSARVLYKWSGYNGTRTDQTQIGYYVYHLDQPGECGENMLWDPGVLDHNRWYCVEGHVRLNTPGSSDGELHGWLDSQLAFSREGMSFRRESESNVLVREFWLNLYHGGTVSATSNMGVTMDQLVLGDSGRIGCFDPFADDEGSVHEPALTELRNLDIYFGCAELASCWEDGLTRNAMAVLLDRAIDFPNTSTDFFDDDNGGWAEAAVNRVAAAGVTLGCSTESFCGKDTITRRQFALMLDRVFEFPVPTQDHFDDDADESAQDVFNALAEAGVIAGCAERAFCPGDQLSRGQAATLIRRSLDWADANA